MFFRNIVYAPFPEGSLAGCTKMGVREASALRCKYKLAAQSMSASARQLLVFDREAVPQTLTEQEPNALVGAAELRAAATSLTS
jgi:hypothetical protein